MKGRILSPAENKSSLKVQAAQTIDRNVIPPQRFTCKKAHQAAKPAVHSQLCYKTE